MPNFKPPRIIRRAWRAVVLLSILIVAMTIASWWLDSEPPLEIVEAKPRSYAAERGDFLTIDYSITRLRECSGSLQRVFIDSQDVVQIIEPYPVNYSDRENYPEPVKVTVTIPVPVGAAVGRARYQAIFHFQCNPLHRLLGRNIEIRSPLIEFDITAGDQPPIFQRMPERYRLRLSFPRVYRASLTSGITPPERRQRWSCPEGKRWVRPHYRSSDGQRIHVRGYCRSRP